MVRHHLIFLMIKHLLPIGLLALASCTAENPLSPDTSAQTAGAEVASPLSLDYDVAHFAQPDKSENLTNLSTSNGTAAVIKLLPFIDPKIGLSLADYPELTPAQFAEIKVKADEVTQGAANQKEALRRLHDYVVNNTKYDWHGKGVELTNGADPNSPYLAFLHKLCVCQGYANLLRVMAISQGIPMLSLNGNLFGANGMFLGGHAWAAAFADGEWTIEDPTNNKFYSLRPVGAYAATLQTTLVSPALFETDEVVLDFYEVHLNVAQVKSREPIFTVPFSYEYDTKKHKRVRITSFNPHQALPKEIKQIYLGDNIQTLGENLIGLTRFGNQVEAVHVSPTNKKLCSEDGAVYSYKIKNKKRIIEQLLYVPAQKKSLKLLSIERLEKNTVTDCPELEAVYVLSGTKVIESYAFERCPKLRTVYLPADCKVEEGAFAERTAHVQLVRGDFTGIRRMRR